MNYRDEVDEYEAHMMRLLCGYDMISSTVLRERIEEEIVRATAMESEQAAFEKYAMDIIPKYFHCDPQVPEMKDEEDDILTSTLMNPRTLEIVTDLFKPCDIVKPREEPKPYHAWTHDHDYVGKRIKTESIEENSIKNSTKVSKSENEPIVEVWNIDSFPQADDVWSKYTGVKGRRKSSRAAELKMMTQARKISCALREVSNNKAKQTRQYKNVRPKNSVETTPSQSDIEEWSSVPVQKKVNKSQAQPKVNKCQPQPKVNRCQPQAKVNKCQPQAKVTKKKTTKGRIDHSESERLRREVLRENFAALCKLVPMKYLRGEKASSQISKQKILDGAKNFIEALGTCKGTYKFNLVQNKHLRSRWQDKKLMRQQIEVSRKCMKKK